MSIVTLDPTTGFGSDQEFPLAPRPATLRGQVLGLVCNGLGDSEIMFDAIGDALCETDGVAGTHKVLKHSVAVPPSPEQWAELLGTATVAVTGFGGCGSCSTRSMRDALDLEEAGIPAVCVVHSALEPAVRAMARLVGADDYPVIVIDYPHNPTAVWTKEEAAELAAQVVDAVRLRLTR
ncbi:MAG: hypothetical protein ACKOIA_02550 [Acidimicrobiia bacterium]